MKLLIVVLGSVALVQPAFALCPGEISCSGHGDCGAWDKCACWRNWQGVDCSERTCPYGTAWADVKDPTVTLREEHFYAECSAKGLCDRETGQCECFEGFEGKGCGRMSCSDDCSGHGNCKLMSGMNNGYSGWDADKIQVCDCDAGWTGIACQDRMCKLGDDPLTLHVIDTLNYQVDEVQTITIDDNGANAITGQFILKYVDWTGETWVTHPINIATATAISVEEALEAIPNNPIPSVTVAKSGNGAASGAVTFTITFDNAATPGNQPLLSIETTGCNLDGCQPVYTALTSAGTLTATVTETTPGTQERAVCSNRGVCNSETGTCTCHSGYYGEACEEQTILM